jgi:hypothetical protein
MTLGACAGGQTSSVPHPRQFGTPGRGAASASFVVKVQGARPVAAGEDPPRRRRLRAEVDLSTPTLDEGRRQRRVIAKDRKVDKIVANLPQLVGVLGAVLAASVGFISFWFNYRATLRNQRDTQFFEALKRFGDEHAAMRTSAAALLAQIAETGSSRWWHDFDRRLPYFMTTLNQLAAGLALETEPVVATAIRSALQQIATLEPHRVVAAVKLFNIEAQKSLVRALATYCAIEDEADTATETAMSRAATASPYDESVLHALIERHSSSERRKRAGYARDLPFAVLRANTALELQLSRGADRFPLRKATLNAVALASACLRDTAEVLVAATRLARPTIAMKREENALGEPVLSYKVSVSDRGLYKPLDLDGTFLVDADFSKKDLDKITFGTAQLDGADFSGSHLQAKLTGQQARGAIFVDTMIDEDASERNYEITPATYYDIPRAIAVGVVRDTSIGTVGCGTLLVAAVLYAVGTRVIQGVSLLVALVGAGALYYCFRRIFIGGATMSAIVAFFVVGASVLTLGVIFAVPASSAWLQTPMPLARPLAALFIAPGIVFGVIVVVLLNERGQRLRYYEDSR